MTTERKSGLDIAMGGRCSAVAYGWTRTTFAAREGKPGAVFEGLNASFASLVEFGGQRIGITSDGVGTKVEVAERVGTYSTLGFDLVAMVADDLAANGIEPTNLSNILDVDHLDERVVDQLMRGLSEAAGKAGVALTGGEIAELGGRIAGWGDGMHFNWCATALGVLPARLKRPIDGSACLPGDVVVSIAERGLRSNGFSLARKILTEAFGERWHSGCPKGIDSTWGECLLTPSVVCCRLVAALIEAGTVPHGIAHITGGGIPDKLGRVLRSRAIGAQLDALHEPPPFVKVMLELGKIPAEEAYRHWNMGNAMLLAFTERDAEAALRMASEQGFEAKVAGRLIDEPAIRIESGAGNAVFRVR